MLPLLNLKYDAFGLDISDLSLKIAKLKTEKGLLDLSCFGKIAIKPGIVEKGEIKDERALSEFIKDALAAVKGEQLNTKHVIVSLPEERAFLQVIRMPLMKERELKKAIYFEAENYIPMSIDEAYLDFQIIKPLDSHGEHLDVLVVAMPRKVVDSYLTCLQQAGLVPLVFEIESQAVARALIKNDTSALPVLLLDLGLTKTSLIIFSGHSLRLTSSIAISSEGFTEAVRKHLKISRDRAEKLKIKYGVESGPDTEPRKVLESLFPPLMELTEEIKKYLDYYQTHTLDRNLPLDSTKIRKVYLCGGGANLKGLGNFLTRELRIPAEKGNPWANILPEPLKETKSLPYEESLAFTTALGLALRGIKES